MKKLKSINKKKSKDQPSLADVRAYAVSIGAGALVGFLLGGVIWLCVGSLIGLIIGFLMEQIHHCFKFNKIKKIIKTKFN